MASWLALVRGVTRGCGSGSCRPKCLRTLSVAGSSPYRPFEPSWNEFPRNTLFADVIGDALQGHVYVQRFTRKQNGWTATDDLRIETVANWLEGLLANSAITGPGVAIHDAAIPEYVIRVPTALREPSVETLFAAGLRIEPLGRDDLFRLEPLYLRGSSAEEKAKREGNARLGVPLG